MLIKDHTNKGGGGGGKDLGQKCEPNTRNSVLSELSLSLFVDIQLLT